MKKYTFQTGGDNQYTDTSIFNLIGQYAQQPNQNEQNNQTETEDTKDTVSPDEEPEFSYKNEDFKSLQDKYDALEKRVNDINGSNYSGDDNFLNFLFDDSQNNDPINFNSINDKKNEYKQNLAIAPTTNGTNNLAEDIAKRESGGDYTAYNPAGGGSGAVGKYQFRWNIHKNDIANVTGVTDMQEFRHNPQAQEDYYKYWENNTLIPQAQKIQQIAPNVPLKQIEKQIHFAGVKGARDYYEKGKITKDANGTTNKTYQIGGSISQQGYNYNSPYKNEPYLDIHSPTGNITMENTRMPLLGIDEYNNKQLMQPGKKYKFQGQHIREIKL